MRCIDKQGKSFEVQKFNSQRCIGIALPNFSNESEIVHGGIIAECLGIPMFMCFVSYLSLITFYYQKPVINKSFVSLISLKYSLIISLFVIFSIIRYFLILFTFSYLWNTQFWPFHYFIGHDIIGTLVQVGEIFCYMLIVYKIPVSWIWKGVIFHY